MQLPSLTELSVMEKIFCRREEYSYSTFEEKKEVLVNFLLSTLDFSTMGTDDMRVLV